MINLLKHQQFQKAKFGNSDYQSSIFAKNF